MDSSSNFSAVGDSRPDRESAVTMSNHHETLTAQDVATTAIKLRAAIRKRIAPAHAADALARACERWRDRGFEARRRTVSRIAVASGFSEATLDESLDALLAPFTAQAFAEFALRVKPRSDLVGFVLPGNVAGAGLHEIVIALVAGRALLLKTASSEPVFFEEFTRTLVSIDPVLAARVAVMNWGRESTNLTEVMLSLCDRIAVYGDDGTINSFASRAIVPESTERNPGCSKPRMAGFGARFSGALVAHEAAIANCKDIADAIARDVALFEQRGCLSPHHIFVETRGQSAHCRDFAEELAHAMERASSLLPPPTRLELEDAAAIRRVRELARWRNLGGYPVQLWEGPGLEWSVVYDASESGGFTVSPGYRTVFISPIGGLDELTRRLTPMRGQIEAFSAAGPGAWLRRARGALTSLGVSYVCAPGAMQSPPLNWHHGGGAFLRMILEGQ